MTDVSMIVMARSNLHDVAVHKQGGRWKKGEIVDILSYEARHGGNINGPHILINVTDIPATLAKIKEKVLGSEDNAGIILRRCRWRGAWSDVPTAIKQELQANGKVTVTWAKLKTFIKRQSNGQPIQDVDLL